MIDYIKGKIAELTPAFIIIENQGTGYYVNISLSTFTKLEGKSEFKILIHEVIREDSHQLFGFADKQERDLFRQLISVTGVGPGTARVMLSSLNTDEIEKAILGSEVATLKAIKGIGIKTAQRIIVDLKDKLGKPSGTDEIFLFADNTKKEEALSALV
nr:Holliday junction branch migration protein RuvA [Bacteroidales bacterium]